MTYRSFIALVLAAALAITGMTTAPARAGDNDAKIIAGAAALAIIGLAIASSNSRDKHVTVTRRHAPRYDHDHGHKPRHHDRYGHKPKRHHRAALPDRCWREGYNRHGKVRGYGRHCLHKRYAGFNALPHDCATRARDHKGRKGIVYRARCLRKHGFH